MKRFLALAVSVAGALAGCSGLPPSSPTETPTPSEPQVASAWHVSNSTVIGYVGVGTFFVTWRNPTEGHWGVDFQVPGNASRLQVAVEGAMLNRSASTAGQYVLIVEAPDGTRTQKNRFEDQNQTVIVNAPARGGWQVRLTPSPASLNQHWTVVVSLSGVGTGPSSLPLGLIRTDAP